MTEMGAPEPKACAKCGQPHKACRAHNNRGNPCTQGTKGLPVCHFHGGKSPQVIAKYEREKALAIASKAMVTYGAPEQTDPIQGLIDEIARTAGHIRWLGRMIEDLQPDALVWNTTETVSREAEGHMAVSYKDVSQAAVPSPLISLYQSERSHLVIACKVAVQCGIAERQIRIAEKQGELIAQLLKGFISDPELGLSPSQQEIASKVASRHLRLVS